MSCKANSSSKPLKFQPMPMAALIANLKALPATLNHRESSDSSDDSISPYDKVKKPVPRRGKERTPIPKNATSGSNKENHVRDRSYFDRVHVMPTIEASTTTSQSIVADNIPKRTTLTEKKESARCLFPEPVPKETHQDSIKYVISDPPKDLPSEPSLIPGSVLKETPKQASNTYVLSKAPKDPPSEPILFLEPVPKETPKQISNTYVLPKAPKDLPSEPSLIPGPVLKETPKQASNTYVLSKPPKDPPSEPILFLEPVPKETPKQASNTFVLSKAPKDLPSEPSIVAEPVKEPVPKETSKQVIPNKSEMCQPKEGPSEPSCSKSVPQRTPSVSATPSQPQGKTAKIQFKTVSVKGRKYMVLKKLGAGGSSQVYKVLEISTSNEFALKCVDLPNDRDMAQGFLNEVKVLRDLQKSDRVVKLYEYEYDKPNNYLRLVLEAGETDLAVFLRAHTEGAPPALVLHYWEEMLRAVQQIHAHGIVHADLKPANFLLVSGTLKLIDFGIASTVSGDATSVERTCGKGTFSYISPEALGGDGSQPIKVSFYSDVWSLGCILYSLVYGHTPFAHLSTIVKLVTIRDPDHYIGYPPANDIPPSLIAVLKQCLRYNGRHRPKVADLLKINYMSHNTRSIPDAILAKIQPHVTPLEFSIVQGAKVSVTELES